VTTDSAADSASDTAFDGTNEDATTRAASLADLHRIRRRGVLIEVRDGADAGAKVALSPGGVVVGSGQSADLRLSDDLVSRRHLELNAEAAGVRARDLGSLNGTWLGPHRLDSMLITSDATVRVGQTTLELRFEGAPIDVPISQRRSFGRAVGTSPAIRHVFALLEQAARSRATVLLEGDSGTGKDVLAHALHEESDRRDGPFVVIDCGAIPLTLIESELFGHERGAFTGAQNSRAGAFEQAHGGTIFLDEIGEMPIEMQPKLLRVLESREVRRVGGGKPTAIDVRVVAATNRKLREAVRKREFREDLFYRLAVVHVRIPPLADRPEDVPALATSFFRKTIGDESAELPDDVMRLLTGYNWPGNARELRNVMDRFSTFGRADRALLFGEEAAAASPTGGFQLALSSLDDVPYHDAKERVIEAFHREILKRALERSGGSVTRAAEKLGMPKTSVYRLLAQLRGDGSQPDD
jgi:transcriptional regulator with PAS, ATPase and Fis domain